MSVRSSSTDVLGTRTSQVWARDWTGTALKTLSRAKPMSHALLILTAVSYAADAVGFESRAATQSPEQTGLGPIRDEPIGRTLQFPADRAMGILYLHSDETLGPGADLLDESWWQAWQKVGEARSAVRLPAKGLVRLDVSRAAVADLSPLERLAPDSIDILNIASYGLQGSGLRYVGHLKGLRCLFIFGINITDLDRRMAHTRRHPRTGVARRRWSRVERRGAASGNSSQVSPQIRPVEHKPHGRSTEGTERHASTGEPFDRSRRMSGNWHDCSASGDCTTSRSPRSPTSVWPR